jgi:hypothetical protein
MYDVWMFSVVIAAIVGMQPLCTQSTFVQAMGPSLHGENEFVARAVFNEYLEQSRKSHPEDQPVPKSPENQLAQKQSQLKNEISKFEELLDSLSVMHSETGWTKSIANLRRTVLLKERNTNNPWNGVVWVDVPSLQQSPDELIFAIDQFLIKSSAADQADRFAGSYEQRFGRDPQRCIAIEKRIVSRWCEYHTIIKPYMTPLVEQELYPSLDQGTNVRKLHDWILENVKDDEIISSANNCFNVWNQVHKKQKNATISLVLHARKTLGIDPWSSVCRGSANLNDQGSRATLLRHTAEISEVNKGAMKTLFNLLTDEQKASYDSNR